MWNKKKNTGFTLVELMTVVLVVSIGIVGVVNLISQILLYTRLNQSKLIASYLAQEGIEIVRNIRDTNWLEQTSWDDGIPASPPDYALDYLTQSLPDTRCNLENPLKIDDNGFYSCEGNTLTKFKRKINIQKTGDTISVLVTVSFEEMGKNYEVRALEKLYNWK